MTTRMDALVAPVAALTDDLGVLSVYIDADPARIGARRPEWEVVLRSGIAGVRDRAHQEEPHERWTAIHAALDALADEIAALCEQDSHGRGRALFAALSTGETRTLRLQVPLPDAVVLAARAHLVPLVAALEAAAPVGILNVARDGVRMVDHAFGESEEVGVTRFDEDTGEWTRRSGTSGHNPALGTPRTGGAGGGGPATGAMYQQSGSDQRDRFDRAVEDHRVRFLRGQATRVAALAAERDWERLVLVGDPRLTGPLRDALPADLTAPVLTVEGTVEWSRPHELTAYALPHVEAARREATAGLVAEARERAAAGGAGCVEIDGICDALFQGRVATLLLAHGSSRRGVRAPDGRLAPDGRIPDGVARTDLVAEPDLVERMLEMALDTSAAALVVDGDSGDALRELGGAAAILRW